MLTIQVDYSQLIRAAKLLSNMPNKFAKAQRMSTKRAIETMRTVTARKIPEKYHVKPARVRKAITMKMQSDTSGLFIVTGRRMSLSSFYMTPKKNHVKNGLKVAVRRDTGIKSIPKGFLIRAPNSGKYLPFIRTGRARTQIAHLVSPAIPQMIEKNEEIQAEVINSGQEAFEKNLSFWVSKYMREGI